MAEKLIRHIKRGSIYTVLGEAELQLSTWANVTEGQNLVIYRCIKTGKLWARPFDEINDPERFEAVFTK